MGFLDFFKSNKQNNILSAAQLLNGYKPVFSGFGNDVYASDVVQQAIYCIVKEMRKLQPQHVILNGSDPVPVNDSLQRLLQHPNPLMNKADFLERITWAVMLRYNCFIVPVYEEFTNRKTGTVRREYRALYPVTPSQIEWLQDGSGEMWIRMRFVNGYVTELPYNRILHIRSHFYKSELMGGNESGEPDFYALLKTLQINQDMISGVSQAMKSSFAINGVVKYNTMLDKGKTEEAIKDLEEKLLSNRSGFLPLDLKMDYVPLNKQIQMVDDATLKFIDTKILRHFGVPLCILSGDYTPQQYEAFYQSTLEPIIVGLHDEFTRVLFTDREYGVGHRIFFYPKNLIFMSMDQILETIRMLGDSGALYENEKRTMIGLVPLPELSGIRMMSKNYGSVESVQNMTGTTTQEEGQHEEESNGIHAAQAPDGEA